MKITNKLKLPEPLVNAVRNDPYDSGKSDISCTGLIGSPWARQLAFKNKNKITEDASERIYALLGQSVHSILERAKAPGYRVEERLFHTIPTVVMNDYKYLHNTTENISITLSGQFDLITPDGTLQDYKVTSWYACKDGPKIEWEQQLNVLRFLCWKNQIVIDELQIVAILRDWSRANKIRHGKDYPDQPVMVIDVPMWDLSDSWDFVSDRIQAHFFNDPEPCTVEERWRKPDSWAVKKKGNKKATKVFYDQNCAKDFQLDKGGEEKFEIEFRPGEDTRCLHYCSVASFCKAKV